MDSLSRTWGMWIVRGIASVLFGVITLLRPGASIAAIVLVYGVYALADGGLLLGFGYRTQGPKTPYILRGLVSVAAGAVALVYPGLTAISLYILVGLWAIAAGATELALAVVIRKEATSVGGLALAGVLSLACGVALLALPLAGVAALLGVIAAYALIQGAFLIAAGIRIHSFGQALRAA